MQIEIIHENLYSYDSEVFLEPHLIRLYPKISPFVAIIDENIEIYPKPILTSKNTDSEGNTVLGVWFEEMTTAFEVNTKFKLETKPFSPFDFFTNPIDLGFPFEYSENDKKTLAYYIASSEILNPELVSILDSMKNNASNSVVTFLISLAEYIYKNYEYIIRENGNPLNANETFAQKKGSCRDFSVLFMEAARYMGLASKFVSGYKLNNKEDEEFHLHAWVEIYIPGGGWRGVDPSIGLFTDGDYIALCASYLPKNTAPIFGFTRGESKNTQFSYKIDMKIL